jgi:hemerythrin superfamily protein
MAKAPRTSQSDAVELLQADHDKVKKLFAEFERAGDQAIAQQIFKELEIHATIEEELFYPAFEAEVTPADLGEGREEGEDPASLIATAHAEHEAVKDFIHRLREMGPESPQYLEVFETLHDAVLDHATEEEEVVFPAAKLKLNIEDLGVQLQERRIKLAAEMATQ